MKKLLFLIAILCGINVHAQNYLISFAGTGASTSVTTVKVENLMKGTTLTINGTDILRLTGATGVNSIVDNKSYTLKIYPNPMTDNSTLEVFPPVAGNAVITVYEMTGKPIAQIQIKLEYARQDFKISGVKNGLYIISVKGNNYQLSGIILSNSESNGTIKIEKVNRIIQAVDEKVVKTNSKGTLATIDMAYSTGDRLKFTGLSGNYSTVKIDIPVSDKTITFNFIACTDFDNNNYSVVEIGTQTWMAENLKTTRFNDGIAIPLVTDNTAWLNLTTPGYCWYNNDEATFKATYGVLYNWFTVSIVTVNIGNLCPIGWHVPSDANWTTLTTYLGGEGVAGGKLKETGIAHWISPNTGATNETGFTALAGGKRGYNGAFDYIGIDGDWWSTKPNFTGLAFCIILASYRGNVERLSTDTREGFSVRCIQR